MNKSVIILLSLTVIALCSCRSVAPDKEETIAVVNGIITDRTNPYHGMMSEVSARPEGGIYIIGREREARRLCRKLRYCDVRDNVTGAREADGLPDFAGETLVTVTDTCSLSQDKELLRELAVRRVLLSLDTLFHISPFDIEGRGVKSPAKMVILVDPCFSVYGKSDIDTLFSCFSCNIPVISPIDLMLENAFKENRNVNVGIICDKGYEEVHRLRFGQFREKYGSGSSCCSVFSLEDNEDPLKEFLDRYMASGHTRPIDLILVNSSCASASDIKAEVVDMISLLSSKSLIYSKFLSDNFHVADAADAVASACYSFLRTANLFTHRISMPVCEYFCIGNSGNLIQESYVQN